MAQVRKPIPKPQNPKTPKPHGENLNLNSYKDIKRKVWLSMVVISLQTLSPCETPDTPFSFVYLLSQGRSLEILALLQCCA